jgi:predicted TIM-barrel fold metal-dependent hydrolase
MPEPPESIPIVDAHHHLWDLTRNHYPWLAERPNEHFFLGDYGALRRNYLPADYRADAEGHDVVATVHVEAEWDRADQVGETAWVASMADDEGLPDVMVGHAWFDDPDVEAVLEAHAAHPRMRGIRSKPARPGQAPGDDEARGSMSDPAWRRGFALLARYGLSWDLRVPHQQLGEAAALVGAYPDIAVALNHTGFPWDRSAAGLAAWRASLRTLAERPNVHVKLSELGLRDAPWRYEDNRAVVLDAIEIFGAERCMFASNFPVAGLRIDFGSLYDAYKRMVADFTPAERRALFCDNAARFYRIDLG